MATKLGMDFQTFSKIIYIYFGHQNFQILILVYLWYKGKVQKYFWLGNPMGAYFITQAQH